ncbi:MAG: glycosyltransferase [Elusimicrobiales bacterium]|nr:glycosyltransferase [Elusimicrobiales bacterium]
MPEVSVVIPVYNGAGTIGLTLDALLAQTQAGLEIIVVDDGSTDSTPAVAGRFGVKYLRQENRGAAAARNLGWRAASGRYVLFTDSDCVPDRDWARALVRLLDEGAGAAGGTYTLANPESLTASCIHYEIQYRHARLPREVRYLGSFSLGVPREVLESLGGFDESFRIACGEDSDLTYRIAGSGRRLLFTREARTGHFFPENARRFLVQQFWRGYWIMKLAAKHPGRLGNDDYSGIRDAVQPPLFALSAVSLPFCAAFGWMPHWLALNLAAFLINLPPALFAARASGRARLLWMLPLLYLRGFCWAAGCAAGTVRFILLKK